MIRCEAEVDVIRLELYEETKNLTVKERIKRSRENAQKLAKEFGFTIISTANEDKAISNVS